MKQNIISFIRLRLIAGAIIGFSALNFASAANEEIPTGKLTVNSDAVLVGDKVGLSWDINFPVPAKDLVKKDPDGKVQTEYDVRVQVRVLASAFGNNVSFRDVTGNFIVNGQTTKIFYGAQPKVKTSDVVFDKVISKGSTIHVEGVTTDDIYDRRGRITGTYPLYCSTSKRDKSIVALFDGEALPAHQASSYPNMQLNALDYIANYMTASNKANIGDNQIIYLGDFNGFGNAGYDLNDFVILVTFTPVAK